MGIETSYIVTDTPTRESWADFVFKHPQGNIFQTPQMFEVYQCTPNNNAGVLALQDKGGNILALMVYTLISESGIKRFFSTRSIVSGGPLVFENNIEYASLLLSEYNNRMSKTRVIYTEIRNLYDVSALLPAFNSKKFVYEDHLTIHMNLTRSVDQLENALHRGRSSNIKRAIKKGLTTRDISSKEEIALAYDLIKDTYERINLPSPPPELFLNASDSLKGHIKFFAAFLNEKLIGCRVYLIYKDMIYDWYAAGDRNFSGYHPSDLLPWKGMLWAKENNIKIYDFAGAGKPGIEYSVRDYKLKFGGELISLGRYQHIHKAFLFRLGVFGLKIYKYIR
jgi:serine/alanine adding enzyme